MEEYAVKVTKTTVEGARLPAEGVNANVRALLDSESRIFPGLTIVAVGIETSDGKVRWTTKVPE